MSQSTRSSVDVLPPSTLSGQVYERLRRAILSGELAAGQRLRTQEIARRFGVSFTPVRESLQRLAEEGLIEFRPHRGATVLAPQWEDFLDMFAVRAALERLAIISAHGRLTAADFDALAQTLAVGRGGERAAPGDQEDTGKWIAADERFHSTIIGRCGNRLLIRMLESLRDRIRLHRETYFAQQQRIAQALDEHEAILAALKQHSADAAAAAMFTHLTSYRRDLDERRQADVDAESKT